MKSPSVLVSKLRRVISSWCPRLVRCLLSNGVNVLVVISLAISSCSSTPKSETKVEDLKGSINRGVQFLIEKQWSDGSWGTFHTERVFDTPIGNVSSFHGFQGATTALCCLGLMELDHPDPATLKALKKGLRFLIDKGPVRRADRIFLFNNWALAFTLQAFCRAMDRDDLGISRDELIKAAQGQIDYMGRYQSADGGWGYYDYGFVGRHPTGRLSSSFNTATSLYALWEAQQAGLEVPEPVVKAGLRSLSALRLPTKLFRYGNNFMRMQPRNSAHRIQGALVRTQPANLALYSYQHDVTQADLIWALDKFFEYHLYLEIAHARPYPHETWFQNSGYYFFYGHFYVAEVIKRLPKEKQGPYWQKLSQVIYQTQQPDGSWWDFILYGYQKEYGTGLALATLIPGYQFLSQGTPLATHSSLLATE